MDLKIKTETMDTEFNPWRVKSLEDFTSVVYSCPECESSFSTSEQFVCHAMISHQKARDTLPEILNIQDIVPEIREEEKSATTAKQSVNQDFHEVEQESEECVEVYKCDLCPMFFNSEAERLVHKNKGHQCEFCTVTSVQFSVQGKLNHMSESHNIQCDQCHQIFRLKKDLKYHECQIRKMENGHDKGKKAPFKITIDCSHPVESGIMNCGDFETYLSEQIRKNGKARNKAVITALARNFGENVTVGHDENKIILTSAVPFGKYFLYLSMLTKKYLKKNNLIDSWRIHRTGSKSYELRYFPVNNNDDDVTHHCELCPSFFNSKVGLKNHKSHSHNFKCHQCRQIFRLKKDLNYHESQTH